MRALILAVLCVTACEIEPCDPGQKKIMNASCVPDTPPPDGGGGASTGGSSTGGSSTGGSSTGGSNGEPGGEANAAGTGDSG
jgi:hypothetical protein